MDATKPSHARPELNVSSAAEGPRCGGSCSGGDAQPASAGPIGNSSLIRAAQVNGDLVRYSVEHGVDGDGRKDRVSSGGRAGSTGNNRPRGHAVAEGDRETGRAGDEPGPSIWSGGHWGRDEGQCDVEEAEDPGEGLRAVTWEHASRSTDLNKEQVQGAAGGNGISKGAGGDLLEAALLGVRVGHKAQAHDEQQQSCCLGVACHG